MRTEKKLVKNSNGTYDTIETPKFEMPTEVRKPNFKPEGRMLLCDVIPFEKDKLVESNLPGHNMEWVTGEKTESGLVLSADKKKDKALKAIVNAIGSEVRGYEIGDIVIYKPNPQAVAAMEIEGHTYIIMEQYNLLGKYL